MKSKLRVVVTGGSGFIGSFLVTRLVKEGYEVRVFDDFSRGGRGEHYAAYRSGTNVVFLDPDVALAFVDSASVNQALRLLLQLARTNVPLENQPHKTVPPTNRAPRRTKKSKPRRATRG